MTLRQAREEKGWTQEQLAEKSGVEQTHISKIERGDIVDPKNSTVHALETALRVRRGTLVFGSQSESAVA